MRTLFEIIGFPFVMAVESVKDSIISIRGKNPEDSSDPLHRVLHGMALIPAVMALVMFFYTIITFAVGHGYVEQVSLFQKEGIKAVRNVWTVGNVGSFYSVWLSTLVGTIFLVSTVVAIVDFFKESGTGRKVGLIITAVIFAGSLISFIKLIKEGNIGHSVLSILIGAAVLIIMGFVLAHFLSDYDSFLNTMVNTILYLVIVPLTCLALENILGIVGLIVALIAVRIALSFCGCLISSSPESSGSGSTQSASENAAAQRETAKKQERITILRNKLESEKHGLSEHYKGSWSYGHVDPRYSKSQIDKYEKELKSLEQ